MCFPPQPRCGPSRGSRTRQRSAVVRRRIKASLYEMRLFVDEPLVLLRAQKQLIISNLRYLGLMLRPGDSDFRAHVSSDGSVGRHVRVSSSSPGRVRAAHGVRAARDRPARCTPRDRSVARRRRRNPSWSAFPASNASAGASGLPAPGRQALRVSLHGSGLRKVAADRRRVRLAFAAARPFAYGRGSWTRPRSAYRAGAVERIEIAYPAAALTFAASRSIGSPGICSTH